MSTEREIFLPVTISIKREIYKADIFSRYEMSVSFETTLSEGEENKMQQIFTEFFPEIPIKDIKLPGFKKG